MNERVNKMNELQEQHKKLMVEWLASVPHVDELLALQLQGTIPKQMPGDVQTNGYLREIAQKSRRELDKARYILERQAKAGVVTIPYYADEYPRHFCGLGNDAPPLIHVLGNRELLNREDNVTIIGDIVYPKSNKALQDEILANGGAVLSEHPFGVKANPTRLVARCRMQVVLTQSVIVAQCPVVSGTMYAVHFAQEYNEYSYDGWESSIYAVSFAEWNERNSGNEYLLDSDRAVPIIPGPRLALDDYNRLVLE